MLGTWFSLILFVTLRYTQMSSKLSYPWTKRIPLLSVSIIVFMDDDRALVYRSMCILYMYQIFVTGFSKLDISDLLWVNYRSSVFSENARQYITNIYLQLLVFSKLQIWNTNTEDCGCSVTHKGVSISSHRARWNRKYKHFTQSTVCCKRVIHIQTKLHSQ